MADEDSSYKIKLNSSSFINPFLETVKGNLGVLILTSGLWNFAGSLTGPFETLYLLGLGANYVYIGFLASIWSFVRIFSLLFGGSLADKIGRRPLLVYLSFALSAESLYMAFIPDWRYVIIQRVFDGIISGLRGPSFSAIIADSIPLKRRAMGYALWQIMPPIFGLFSPLIAGNIIDVKGVVSAMRIFYLVVFFFSFTACLIRWKFIKETFKFKLESNESRSKLSLRDVLQPIREMNVSLKAWLFMSFLGGIFSSAAAPYWVDYAVNVVGISKGGWGLIDTSRRALNLAVTPIFASLSDRYGRLKFIIPILFISPIVNVGFTYSHSFRDIYLWLLLATFFSSISSPSLSALMADYTPRKMRGRISAYFNIIGSIANVIGGFLGGYIYQNISKGFVFILISISGWIIAFMAIIFFKEPKERFE